MTLRATLVVPFMTSPRTDVHIAGLKSDSKTSQIMKTNTDYMLYIIRHLQSDFQETSVERCVKEELTATNFVGKPGDVLLSL
jgi:hypothetical protein